MNNRIVTTLLALFWSAPSIALTVLNRTNGEFILTLSSSDRATQLNVATIPANSAATIDIPQNLVAFHASIDVPKSPERRMTTIEPYNQAMEGWLAIGQDADNNPILMRLLPPGMEESIPANVVTSTYKKIGDSVVRIDEYPAATSNLYQQVVQTPIYTGTINPASALFITELKPNSMQLALYDPKVISAARAGYKRH